MPNRLAQESSPYLLQHAENPVDWYPWGDEAFARARADDRPILLSVGYSACHWCHVMEHESFEDPATAAVMNELYVNVKVDREERPDVDSVYMSAVTAMTGHGGWPMTVFLTPEGTPFWGGTYFPPEPRHGLPSFQQVLQAISDAYRNRREAVEQSASELHEMLRQGAAMRAPSGALDVSALDRAYHLLAARFDARNGGFGAAPKFPQPMALEFMLRQAVRTGSGDARRIVEHTLRRMAAGGIRDHLGGGFHRYSVDAHWLVPHFEKMLYDNALLARLYLNAWQATREEGFRAVAEDTLAYVERDLLGPHGGFYATEDADSEGEEGIFYVWTPEEVDALLGPEDGPVFRAFYDVAPGGNFEGRSILHADRPPAQVAKETGVSEEALAAVLERGRPVLFAAREERIRPGRDEKVIVAWNAMMMRAFAEAARALESDRYRQVAVRNAEFLLRELRPEGRLMRTWKDGRARVPAFLDDHALLADALLSLYAATWDPRWVREARALADEVIERFWDEGEGIFFDAGAEESAELPVRPRELYDNATPSGSSAAALMLVRLARLTGEERYAKVAERAIEGTGELLARAPIGFGLLLSALDHQLSPHREVAFVGIPGEEATDALLRVVGRPWLPNVTVALRAPDAAEEVEAEIPLLAGRTPVEGKPAAYVCERFACRMPVTTPDALAAELAPS